MKEYSQAQKQGICDALTMLVEDFPASIEILTWLKCVAPSRLSRTMHVDVTWDEDQRKFVCQ
jgi:hypothetical protein